MRTTKIGTSLTMTKCLYFPRRSWVPSMEEVVNIVSLVTNRTDYIHPQVKTPLRMYWCTRANLWYRCARVCCIQSSENFYAALYCRCGLQVEMKGNDI